MPSTTTLRVVRGLLIVVALFAAIWTAMWFFLLINRIALVRSEDDYVRGTLVVESTELETITTGTGGNRMDRRIWWAVGTVRVAPPEDGRAAAGASPEFPGERMSLKPVLDEPASEAALAAAVPPGTAYDVWFHPGMPEALSQDEWLRVVAYDPDFFDDARRMRNGIARMTVLPLGLALAGIAVTTVALRRRSAAAAAAQAS